MRCEKGERRERRSRRPARPSKGEKGKGDFGRGESWEMRGGITSRSNEPIYPMIWVTLGYSSFSILFVIALSSESNRLSMRAKFTPTYPPHLVTKMSGICGMCCYFQLLHNLFPPGPSPPFPPLETLFMPAAVAFAPPPPEPRSSLRGTELIRVS